MRLLISAPTGFNAREIILPLRRCLSACDEVTEVVVACPVAEHREELFRDFGAKFVFVPMPKNVASANRLIKGKQCDALLTPTAGLDPLDVPLLLAAKKCEVPAVVFVASWDNVFKMARLKKHGYSGAQKDVWEGGLVTPDFVAVWNEMNHRHVLDVLDVPAERVRIVGSPRFDFFAHAEHIPSKAELIEYLGLKAAIAEKPLLHGATTELYPFDYIVRQLTGARTGGDLPDFHLHASVHPGGDISRHKKYREYGASVAYSFGRRDTVYEPTFAYLPTEREMYMLVALFAHTDVLVNQSSTVAIESMRADVPVVNVAYGAPRDWWRWHRSMVRRDFKEHYRYITNEDGAAVATKPEKMIAAVRSYIRSPELQRTERKRTVEKLIGFTDGSASQRLLDFTLESTGL